MIEGPYLSKIIHIEEDAWLRILKDEYLKYGTWDVMSCFQKSKVHDVHLHDTWVHKNIVLVIVHPTAL